MPEGKALSPKDRTRRAREIYESKLKAILEPTHAGKVVAIDIETHAYYIADDPMEACRKGRSKQPNTVFVCRRIGNGPLYRVGAF